MQTKSSSSSPRPCFCVPSEESFTNGLSDGSRRKYRALPPSGQKEDTDGQLPDESLNGPEQEVWYRHYKPYHYPGCLCRECGAWSQMYKPDDSQIPPTRVYNIYYATVITDNQRMCEEYNADGNICLGFLAIIKMYLIMRRFAYYV